MNTIFTMVMVFMSIMSDNGYNCEILETMENTAIVECHTADYFVVEWLDARENETILMEYGRVV